MSKNLTRKGLAFGATVALGATLFAGAPASAAGIDNGNVSLAPNAGAEYDITAGAEFDLKANFANAAKTTGAWLKFQVEDASAKTTVLSTGTSQYSVTTDGTADLEVVNGGGADSSKDLVKVYIAVADHKLKQGDRIVLTGVSDDNDGATGKEIDDATDIWTIASVASTYVTFEVPADSYSAALNGGSAGTGVNDALTMSLVASERSATGVYVFDTKSDTNNADKTLRLDSTDEDVTQTVVVTAWVDNNDNGTIDTTEYQSPARTIRFLKHADITATTSFNPIAVAADSTIVNTVTFTPTLNGSQLIASNNRNGAANAVKVNLTRPGSTATLASATTTYSNTTKQWTVTSAGMDDASADDVEVAGSTTTGWNISQPNATNLYIGSISITKDVVTATTSATGSRSTPAAHGLQVGDLITIASSTTARADIATATKVLSVPSTTTFTYAAAATGADLAATAQSAGTITVTKILRNYAVAGTYTAQVLLYKDASTNALTKVGAAVSSTGVAVTASSATIEAVSSATLSATASNASTVYTGTKTANFVGKVLDADGAAVGAGLDAAITATTVTSAGTVKINGTTVVSGSVVYAKTDANGQVAIAVENSSALANESVELDLDIQGVDATNVTATWGGKVYSIVDLNDNSAVASGARTRAVADGASYTFDLLVQDQFKAPAGADIRLKAVVAGRSASTQIVALNAGKATLTVADAGLATTGDTTVNLSFQLATSGVWADVDTGTYADWDGTNGSQAEDQAAVAIKYYTQTDALTLNADGANYPSTTAADYSAATTTKALTAVDKRVSNAATSTVVAAGKAVVSGNVANATTGAAKSGQVVTITGAGLLFKSGDVWTIGSASQIAADGTFAFDIYSANPGTITVTVAAGSVTKTAKLTFTGASTTSKKLTVTPNAATYIAGQTVLYTVKLTDGNGNAVDTTAPAATPAAPYISVSYAGPGIISGSLPVETDADGIATVRIVTGVVDTQAAVLTVKYDQNYDGDFADEYDLTVSSSVSAYVAPAVVAPEVKTTIVGVTKAIRVRVENAKGEEVEVVVNGKTVAVAIAGTNSKLWVLAATKGKKSVKVYVDGDLAAVKTVTVK